jgi:hypothetical protein
MFVFGKYVITPMDYWVPSLRKLFEERCEVNKSLTNKLEEMEKLNEEILWSYF